MKVFGIIGYPLSHSFSQKYFTDKFRQEGITDCRYEAFPMQSVHELDKLIQARPEIRGLNVTIPHKQTVLTHLHDQSMLPKGLRACNCIRIIDGKLQGHNTDIIGFERSLLPLLPAGPVSALVLGTGGAAKAVEYVLDKVSIDYKLVSRKPENGKAISYSGIDRKIMNDHQLIINTTPLGSFPGTGSYPQIPYQYIGGGHILYDLVYNPARTMFLQKGEEQGATIKNGYEMLTIQAEESWRLWDLD